MGNVKSVFCVQQWVEYTVVGGMWKTLYAATFRPDAEQTYDDAQSLTEAPLRLVQFAVDGVDFIAVHARDFRVLHKR